MNEEPNLSFAERMNRSMNVFLFVCSVFALPGILLLRNNLGKRFVGVQALAAVAAIALWPAFAPEYDPHPMIWLLWTFLGLCFLARMGVLRRGFRGGDHLPRHYNGTPRLLRFMPRCDEVRFKRFIEPPLLALLAVAVMAFNVPLGVFCLCSAAGVFFTESAIEIAERDRVESMLDQTLAQQILMERFRRLRGK